MSQAGWKILTATFQDWRSSMKSASIINMEKLAVALRDYEFEDIDDKWFEDPND